MRIRVTAAGGKTFLSTIHINGKRKVFTLGTYPATSLADAREDLPKMKARAKNGTLLTNKETKVRDAAAVAQQEKVDAVGSRTVDQCLAEFEKNVIGSRKQAKPALKLINSEFRGKGNNFSCDFILADIPVREVTLDHIKLLTYSIKERGAVIQAKKVLDMVKQFLRWCLGMQYIDTLPYHNIGSYWTPHTLRKTFRSHIKRWTAFEVAERCLNHSLGKIANTYDLSDDLDERRKAFDAWSDYVYRHCYESQSNVIKIGDAS